VHVNRLLKTANFAYMMAAVTGGVWTAFTTFGWVAGPEVSIWLTVLAIAAWLLYRRARPIIVGLACLCGVPAGLGLMTLINNAGWPFPVQVSILLITWMLLLFSSYWYVRA
jgi:hypothetical protein